MTKNKEKAEVGDWMVCVASHSSAYKRGHHYEVVEVNDKKGLIGEDGLFDPLSQLISEFKKVERKSEQLKLVRG